MGQGNCCCKNLNHTGAPSAQEVPVRAGWRPLPRVSFACQLCCLLSPSGAADLGPADASLAVL
jgi:hypothetical protein